MNARLCEICKMTVNDLKDFARQVRKTEMLQTTTPFYHFLQEKREMETVKASEIFVFENEEFAADVCINYNSSSTIVRLDHYKNTAFWIEFDLGELRNQYVKMRGTHVEERFFERPYIAGRYDSGASKWEMKLDKKGTVSIVSVSLSNIGQRSITPFLSFNITNFIE